MTKPLFALVALSGAVYSIDKPYTYSIPEALLERAVPGVRVIVPFGRGNRRREGFVLACRESSAHPSPKAIAQVLDAAPVLDSEGIKLALWLCERTYCTFFDAFRAMVPTGLLYVFSDRLALLSDIEREAAYSMLEGQEIPLRLLEMLYASGGELGMDEAKAALGNAFFSAQKTLVNKGIVFAQVRGKHRVGDKTEKMVSLLAAPEEAREIADAKGRGAQMQKAVLRLLADLGSALSSDICYFTGCSPVTLKALERAELVSLTEQEAFRMPVAHGSGAGGVTEDVHAVTLTAEQQAAYERLRGLMDRREPVCALLHGVTGSGKTSVYVKLIHRALEQGGQALVLVPEIALTPQLMERFTSLFGAQVAVLHSGLSAGERLDEWKRIRKGIARVAVGARSAVFAPFKNLRLIILDEEHEQSYKSDCAPRYHARDVAKYRSARHGALLLLGSATPSLESMHAAQAGIYTHVSLKTRYNDRELPAVTMADLRAERRRGFDGTVGSVLRAELEENLARGEQAILFLNRRGYNRCLICGECAEAPACPHCSVSLTYHAANNRLMCHFCGYSEPHIGQCVCGGPLRPVGAGTQRVAEELETLFPEHEILRMDADTTSGRGGHQRLLHRFRTENIPVLLGTQMVAKGLDFPNVTLVGVIDADAALYRDDYRANERAFALLTQVVGRAGRAMKPGRAVVQTLNPAHPVLEFAARQDYDGFYESEIFLRQAQGAPPFAELLKISIFGVFADTVRAASVRLRAALDAQLAANKLAVRAFGPVPASVTRVNNHYRFQIILSGDESPALRRIVSGLLRAFAQDKRNKNVHAYADPKPGGF